MVKIILSEKKLPLLKESLNDIMANRLPSYVYVSAKDHNTSLGECPAFPPSHDYDFGYKLLKKRYSEILDEMTAHSLSTDETDAENLLGKLTRRAVEIETPIRPELNKLVENTVNAMFAVPYGTILLTCELKDSITPKMPLRVLPEDDGGDYGSYEFKDVKEIDEVDDIVKKRRFIDSLIQGYSLILSRKKEFFESFFTKNGFGELIGLYDVINVLNDYLVFVKEEKINKKCQNLVSYVSVHLGHGGNKSEISSQGLIFPYLLRETIRGFMELFSSHGLPKDNHKAQMIVRMADFTMAEPWDVRFGVPMWDIMFGDKIKSDMIPYFFADFCSLPTSEFFSVSKEMLAKTKKGRKYIKDEIDDLSDYSDYVKFLSGIHQKNAEHSIITDGYLSAEDIDNQTVSKEAKTP